MADRDSTADRRLKHDFQFVEQWYKAGTSLQMFPPCALLLFCFIGFPLCLPLGKLPLSFLALEEFLYLREQDTVQGLHFMEGYPGAVVVDFLLPCHRPRLPLKLPLVEQVALEDSAVLGDEAAPCVFGYLVGGAGVVQDDLR